MRIYIENGLKNSLIFKPYTNLVLTNWAVKLFNTMKLYTVTGLVPTFLIPRPNRIYYAFIFDVNASLTKCINIYREREQESQLNLKFLERKIQMNPELGTEQIRPNYYFYWRYILACNVKFSCLTSWWTAGSW